MPTLNVNDRAIFYAPRALHRQPLLLLIHGAGGSHLDWPPQIRTLEKMGTCAIDLPGHGRSAKPARRTVGAYADDILALVEALDLTGIILAGHSMGGAIALEIALRRPENIAGLVLVATGARLKVNPALIELAGKNYESAVDHIAAAAWGPNAPAGLVKRGTQLMLSCDPAAVQMDFAACDGFDVMSRLDGITIPTLVLIGTEDRLTPPKYGRYLAGQIAQSELVSFSGAGHMLALEQPDEVAATISDFVHRRLPA